VVDSRSIILMQPVPVVVASLSHESE